MHFKNVSRRIKIFGRKLAADKCKLFQAHIEFLCYKMAYGIRPEKDKLKIIKDVQPQKYVKERTEALDFFISKSILKVC